MYIKKMKRASAVLLAAVLLLNLIPQARAEDTLPADEVIERVYYCGLHVHDDGCYGPAIACGQEAHSHSEACMEQVKAIICGLTAGVHEHDSSCYTDEELTCTAPAEHSHGPDCISSTWQPTCGLEEHSHSEACHSATEKALSCGIASDHIHDVTCMVNPADDCDGTIACQASAHKEGCRKELAKDEPAPTAVEIVETMIIEIGPLLDAAEEDPDNPEIMAAYEAAVAEAYEAYQSLSPEEQLQVSGREMLEILYGRLPVTLATTIITTSQTITSDVDEVIIGAPNITLTLRGNVWIPKITVQEYPFSIVFLRDGSDQPYAYIQDANSENVIGVTVTGEGSCTINRLSEGEGAASFTLVGMNNFQPGEQDLPITVTGGNNIFITDSAGDSGSCVITKQSVAGNVNCMTGNAVVESGAEINQVSVGSGTVTVYMPHNIADIIPPDSPNVIYIYPAPDFTINIPAQIDLDNTTQSPAIEILADGEGYGGDVTITATGENGFALAHQEAADVSLLYALSIAGEVFVSGVAKTVTCSDGVLPLTFQLNKDTALYAGKYQGTVVFDVALAD